MYLDSSMPIINYVTLSIAIGGPDWMDGGRPHWMMLPFWEIPSVLMHIASLFAHFQWSKI